MAFITNRSYIDAKNFDGFRKTVVGEFDEIYIIDLGGDWKKHGQAGGGNVFGIGTGVAIGFWIRRPGGEKKSGRLFYNVVPPGSGEEKLAWLASLNEDGRTFEDIPFDEIIPKAGYWVNNPVIEFGSEIPIASKDEMSSKRAGGQRAIFKLFSLGVSTNRDSWVYDFDDKTLIKKVRFLKRVYDEQKIDFDFGDQIKWSETLKRRLKSRQTELVDPERIRSVLYRPYSTRRFYDSTLFVDRPGAIDQMFPTPEIKNPTIFVALGQRGQFGVCATDKPVSLDYFVPNAACLFPRHRYLDSGPAIDNITDWSFKQFNEHYGPDRRIIKDAIFHYVYGILHDPLYQKKYELNLKRTVPYIPFYSDFWRWAEWGQKLMALHIGYETLERWPLTRVDLRDENSRNAGLAPKAILRAYKENGMIQVDGETQLIGIPMEAWTYKIGSRSALEWILDQYAESTSRDKTIRDKFESYSFSKYKEQGSEAGVPAALP